MPQDCCPAPPTPPLSLREICQTCCTTAQSAGCPNPGEWRLVVGGVLAGAMSVAAVRLWQRCSGPNKFPDEAYKRKHLRGSMRPSLEFRKQQNMAILASKSPKVKGSPDLGSSERDSGGSSKEGQGEPNRVSEELRATGRPELHELFSGPRRDSLIDQRTGGYVKEPFGGPNFDGSEDSTSKKDSSFGKEPILDKEPLKDMPILEKTLSKDISGGAGVDQKNLDASTGGIATNQLKPSKETLTVSDLAMGSTSPNPSMSMHQVHTGASVQGGSLGSAGSIQVPTDPSGPPQVEESRRMTPNPGFSSASGGAGAQSYIEQGGDTANDDDSVPAGVGGEEEQTAVSEQPDEPGDGSPDGGPSFGGPCSDPPVRCEHVSEYIEDHDEIAKLRYIGAMPPCGPPVFPICPPLPQQPDRWQQTSQKQSGQQGSDNGTVARVTPQRISVTAVQSPKPELAAQLPRDSRTARESQQPRSPNSTKQSYPQNQEYAPCVDDYALSTTQDDGTVAVFVHTHDGREPMLVRTAGTCPCPQCLPRPPRPSKGVWESIMDTFWPIEVPPEVGCAGKKGFATVALTCCQAASALAQGMSFAEIGCCYERFILINKALDGTTVRTLKKYFTVIPMNVNECNPHEFSHASAVAFLFSLCEFKTLVYLDPTCKVVTRECEDLLDIETLTVNSVISDKLTPAQECHIVVMQPSLTRYEAMRTALDNQAEAAGDCSKVNLCTAILEAFGEPNYLPWQPQKIVVKETQLV